MSWQAVGEGVRQHSYGVPQDHVRCSESTLSRLATVGWRLEGLCTGDDEARWFSQPKSHDHRWAVTTCVLCPVRETCLASALLHGEEFGVWGGTTPTERQFWDGVLRSGFPLERVVEAAINGDHNALAS